MRAVGTATASLRHVSWLLGDEKERKVTVNRQRPGINERLTFPFPFVHLQPLDCKLEQLLTVETKSHGSTGCSSEDREVAEPVASLEAATGRCG